MKRPRGARSAAMMRPLRPLRSIGNCGRYQVEATCDSIAGGRGVAGMS